MTPESVESDKLGPSSEQIQNAPVLQLFDNHLVTRRDDSSNNDQFAGAGDMSPKAQAVRTELCSLIPPREDIQKVLGRSSKLFCMWEENFAVLLNAYENQPGRGGSLVAPAEIAKGLVCFSISILQTPPDFNFNSLRAPLDPQEYATRCCAMVDRLVVRDDDFAATLPGIECQYLLSKFHMNEGRLRKAWLVIRRAIEYANLAGMHLSTRTPRPTDALFERRLKIWCQLATSDRTVSLLLGLPYGVADAFFLPQVNLRLNSSIPAAEQYMLRIGVITGRMVDRNQDPANMCLESTLRLDQELMEAIDAMPHTYSGTEPGPDEKLEDFHDRVPLQFMPNTLRVLLHLPFMLKYPHDPRFSYSHQMALQSTREGLALYKVLRSITRSYLCKMIDFLAFIMGMLLVVHLHDRSEEPSSHSKEQDEKDWELMRDVVAILRQAAAEPGGSVAAESANILGAIYDTRTQKENWTSSATCKITVPYFGTIIVGAGTKFLRPKSEDQHLDYTCPPESTTSSKQTPTALYTPPLSVPEGASAANSDIVDGVTPVTGVGEAQYSRPDLPAGAGVPTKPLTGLESNAFTGLFDDFGQYIWPNPNVDLGLDQGWNLNWFE